MAMESAVAATTAVPPIQRWLRIELLCIQAPFGSSPLVHVRAGALVLPECNWLLPAIRSMERGDPISSPAWLDSENGERFRYTVYRDTCIVNLIQVAGGLLVYTFRSIFILVLLVYNFSVTPCMPVGGRRRWQGAHRANWSACRVRAGGRATGGAQRCGRAARTPIGMSPRPRYFFLCGRCLRAVEAARSCAARFCARR